MSTKPRLETAFERLLFRSRWLMAPFYLGLVVALVVKWLSSFGWAASLLIGAAVGAGYYWLERRRGVI